MKQYIPILALFLFVSCSVKTLPPMQTYTLAINTQPLKTSSSSCKKKTLKVLYPYAIEELQGNSLLYQVDNQTNEYNNSQWRSDVIGLIYQQLLKAVRKSQVFGVVLYNNSTAKSDYILELDVVDFKQYFTTSLSSSFVKVDIVAHLVDKKTYKVVASKEFFVQKDVTSLDAKGGVAALNNALEDVSVSLTQWLFGVCNG